VLLEFVGHPNYRSVIHLATHRARITITTALQARIPPVRNPAGRTRSPCTIAMAKGEDAGSSRVANILVQGIAWINIHNFQIVRPRTDLLPPIPKIHRN
jgi:hypothetical protein